MLPYSNTLSAQSETTLRLVQLEETFSVEVANAVDLLAIEFTIEFDPTQLTVIEDELVSGDCPSGEFIVVNSADNSNGTISYAATQLTTTPCDSGTVATFSVQCAQTDNTIEAQLHFGDHLLASSSGLAIAHQAESATIQCPAVEANTSIEANASNTTASPSTVELKEDTTEIAVLNTLDQTAVEARSIGEVDGEASPLLIENIEEENNELVPAYLKMALLMSILLAFVGIAVVIHLQTRKQSTVES